MLGKIVAYLSIALILIGIVSTVYGASGSTLFFTQNEMIMKPVIVYDSVSQVTVPYVTVTQTYLPDPSIGYREYTTSNYGAVTLVAYVNWNLWSFSFSKEGYHTTSFTGQPSTSISLTPTSAPPPTATPTPTTQPTTQPTEPPYVIPEDRTAYLYMGILLICVGSVTFIANKRKL